jgi:aspartate aminotransferase
MHVEFSRFAQGVHPESAFTVLAIAKRLMGEGKQVYELEIGDSPFASPPQALEAAIGALKSGQTHYGPSLGLPDFRAAAADYVHREFGLDVTPEHIVAGHGAKIFEQLFCELFVNAGDSVLVFSPHFPTYPANIERRGGRLCLAALEERHGFRPQLSTIEEFIETQARPRAIFLNSPHNPTGGVTTLEDLQTIARRIEGTDIAVFSDEPYDQMVWQGRHHSLLEVPGMLDRTVAAYSFSKSFSMSGWRLGFAVSSPQIIQQLGMLLNTTLSCVPPFIQQAGAAAMRQSTDLRDQQMAVFRENVSHLVKALNRVEGIQCSMPGGSFYAFPNVSQVCQEHHITSHGLAMYLLEGADDRRGVACLGGECFGEAGQGFLRLSCAESKERLVEAVDFIRAALSNAPRIGAYLVQHPEYRIQGA